MLVVPESASRERSGAGSRRSAEARLDEAQGLAEAIGINVAARRSYRLRSIRPATLLGKGQVEEIAGIAREHDAGLLIVDAALTPVQQKSLEEETGAKVIDRTGLILEIFGERAVSSEGRLQVELAHLDYQAGRLVRSWTHLERQRGGFGFLGGPGETQIEADRRLLLDRIVRLKADLADVRRTRGLQRQGRKRAPYPIVALVGYTNAGKSTLFNRLTGAEVLAKAMLFATLDPTLRQLHLPNGRAAILSDTVGFISDLPHELVDAFRATRDAVREADLILHVRDIATADSEAQSQDVKAVLDELGVKVEEGRKVLEVWNKIDLLGAERREDLAERAQRTGAVVVSSLTGEGIAALVAGVAALIDDDPERTFELKASDGEALAWLYRHGRVTDRQDTGDHLTITARLNTQALGKFEQLRPRSGGRLAAG